jgi:acyl-phosphate glycerol 3-phosphate acyltransferase
MIILFVLLEYLCGSLMFSYWLARIAKKDLMQVGDGNPGAFNLWHAVGYELGLVGVLLDFLKGYFPLVLFVENGYVDGMYVIPVALAAILGHVFSPVLKFKGGKAIAVTFGVWSALTRFEVSLVFAVILAALMLAAKLVTRGKPTSTEVDALMVVSGMALLGVYIYTQGFAGHLFILWMCNLFILVYTNKAKLSKLAKELDERYQVSDHIARFRHIS